MTDHPLSAQQPLLGSASQGQGYGSHTNSLHGHGQQHGTTVVHFSPGDPQDPRNWSRAKKWLIIGPILLIDLSVSWGASGFSPASKKFAEDFGLPSGMGAVGLSAYVLGLAFGPVSIGLSLRQPQKCFKLQNLLPHALNVGSNADAGD
jgi:hypothetical protein